MVLFVRNSLLMASMFTCVLVVTLGFNVFVLTQFKAFELGVPPPSGLSPYRWFIAQAVVLIPMGAFAFWVFTGRHRQWWALLLAVSVGLVYAKFAPSWTGPPDWHVVYPISYFAVGSIGILAGAASLAAIARWRAARPA